MGKCLRYNWNYEDLFKFVTVVFFIDFIHNIKLILKYIIGWEISILTVIRII